MITRTLRDITSLRDELRAGLRRRATASTLRPLVVVVGRVGQQGLVLIAFVLLARTLGPLEFGAFIAAQGIANLLSPFVEVGGTSLLTRDMTYGLPPKPAFDRVISTILLRAPVFILLIALLGWAGFSASLVVPFVIIGFTEMVVARATEVLYAVNFALDRSYKAAIIDFCAGASRVAAALLLWTVQGHLLMWSVLYGGQYALLFGAAAVYTLGSNVFPKLHRTGRERRQAGMSFAITTCARSSMPELDRVLLARLGGLEIAGIYGAGSRLVYVMTTPFYVYQMMIYPSFFRAGQNGYRAARAVAVRQALLLSPMGAALATALWTVAPYVDLVLGPEYANSVQVIRGLCVIVFIYALAEPFGNALNGAGRERDRRNFQVGALFVNAILNLCLIPLIGYTGAVISALAAHSLLAVLFITAPKFGEKAP